MSAVAIRSAARKIGRSKIQSKNRIAWCKRVSSTMRDFMPSYSSKTPCARARFSSACA